MLKLSTLIGTDVHVYVHDCIMFSNGKLSINTSTIS